MLKEKESSGLFLSMEGPDGAGKTTQARLLKERLEKLGLKVLLTREPGGTPIGEEIRKLLLNPDFREMTVTCEVLLYSAARAQLISQCIYPALMKGYIVISDRYLDSNLVYQGLAGGEKPEMIEAINMWAAGRLLPEVTFLLDIDVETSLLRLQGKEPEAPGWRGDRVEQKELSYHRKVRQGFLNLASREPQRFFVIQAGDRPEAVHEQIWRKTQELLHKRCLLGFKG
jgi:dTMP kinase